MIKITFPGVKTICIEIPASPLTIPMAWGQCLTFLCLSFLSVYGYGNSKSLMWLLWGSVIMIIIIIIIVIATIIGQLL